MKKSVIIMGAGGRDFHDFNTLYRTDPTVRVVAFTAAQIPGIEDRSYPASLAGPLYPAGIPIHPEEDLVDLIRTHAVDEVILAYSDLSHEDVMHKASIAMAAGAAFSFAGPRATMLKSARPVIAICAARTGCGKSQTSRHIGKILIDEGFRVALVRHPMPYGDLEAMRVQRFATLADIDASNPTVEEREEYEEPVRLGMIMYAGVDYEDILRDAELEADVVIWDGGNNDFPFFSPDVMVTVVDPLRPGHELLFHPGETNLRMADVVVVNKVDAAPPHDVATVIDNVRSVNAGAVIVRAASPVTLEAGASLRGRRVLVIEDGPTATHGGMPFGAGTVAARSEVPAEFVDPRPWAVGTIAETFEKYPSIGLVLPAMGYGEQQLTELEATINAVECDVVVSGSPIDLARLIDIRHPFRRATYVYADAGDPTLAHVLQPYLEKWKG